MRPPIKFVSHRRDFLAHRLAVAATLLLTVMSDVPADAAPAASQQAIPVNNAQNALVTDVHVFGAQNGADPLGSLITDGSGNFYGTTETGGAYNLGTIYRLSANGTLTVLHSFGFVRAGQSVTAEGQAPQGALLLAPDGNLYGTTGSGGVYGDGTIFRLNPATLAFATLASFESGTTGSDTTTGLATDGKGNFYGTTQSGNLSGTMADGEGALFVYNSVAGTLAPLVNFNDTDLESPISALLLAPDGNLYGSATYGGANGSGTFFQVNPATGVLTHLVDFGGQNNTTVNPSGPPLADGRGGFYVTTQGGGANFGGAAVAINVNPASNPPAATSRLIYSFGASGFPPVPPFPRPASSSGPTATSTAPAAAAARITAAPSFNCCPAPRTLTATPGRSTFCTVFTDL